MRNIYGTGASPIRKSCKFGFVGLILNVFQIFLYVSVVKKSLTALSAWAIPWKVPLFSGNLELEKSTGFTFKFLLLVLYYCSRVFFFFGCKLRKLKTCTSGIQCFVFVFLISSDTMSCENHQDWLKSLSSAASFGLKKNKRPLGGSVEQRLVEHLKRPNPKHLV